MNISDKVTDTITVTDASNHKLYAQWTANKYTVYFDEAGGTDVSDITVTYASTYGTLPTPTKTNYEFLGWYTAASGGTQVTSGTSVTITANQTLYAQWKLNQVYRCRYRTRKEECHTQCWSGSCCARNSNNNWCISYTSCHCDQSCSWGSWSEWSGYGTTYTSPQSTDSLQVECAWVTP